jgi:hypothetical protein
VSACGAALVWRIGYLATGNAGAAWFGWVSSALTTPFVFLATQIFPDGIGATAVLLGMLPLLDPKATRWSWLISSLALSTLPWLHTRFAILSGLAGIFVAMSLRSPRRIVAFLVLPALSAAAWFGHFFLIYGTFNPSAPYGHYTQTAVSNLVRGIPGLLFDQQFGLIVAAPVYAFILGGLIWGAVGGHRWTWTIVAVSLPYVAAVGMFQMWWGGSSVPARFLTPLCLLLGVAAARLWHEWRLPFTRAAACSLLAVSLFISAVLLIPGHGQLLFNSRDGFALWLEWVNDVVDLPRALPSLFRDSPLRAWLKAGLWVMSASAGWGLLRVMTSRINRRESVREPAWMLPWLFAGSAMLACSLVWRVDHVQPLTPETGVTALLMRVDPEFRSLAYDYATHGFETPRTLLTKLRLQPSTRRPTAGGLSSVCHDFRPARIVFTLSRRRL